MMAVPIASSLGANPDGIRGVFYVGTDNDVGGGVAGGGGGWNSNIGIEEERCTDAEERVWAWETLRY